MMIDKGLQTTVEDMGLKGWICNVQKEGGVK